MGRIPWNKGKTKFTDPRLKEYCERRRKQLQNGEIVNYWLGRKRSEENKRKISESLKLAYKEHRAHNIGQSRWNNEPSYPEKFFMNIIKNEFKDQNYVREYPFKIYSLDFAWPEKKQCIEIDDEQHYRFQEYIERDIRKNKVLTENNWEFLRIPWKDMFSNTKDWIHVAKTFIDNVSTYVLERDGYIIDEENEVGISKILTTVGNYIF